MTLVRWQPFTTLNRVQDEVSTILRDAFEGLDSAYPRSFVPPVDIMEHGENLLLVADLPGLSKDDIELSVENRTLTLAGERKEDARFDGAASFRSERAHGRFSRVFALPATVDVSRISAEFKDGVLTVSLPKAEEAKPRKIEVHRA